MPYPRDIKAIRSFLGHAGFYRRFIKDFSKTSRPLTNLLQKDIPFVFDEDCKEAFKVLKKALITAPIVQPPDWNMPFEIMCDARDFAVGAVLGQRVDKKLNVSTMLAKPLTVLKIIMLLPRRNSWQWCLLVISLGSILLILRLLFILTMLPLSILCRRRMPNQGS